jgi:diguanylate cyclase (GGDEF)-like protein
VWRLDRQRAIAERLSRTDALTGLSNRRDFNAALESVLERGLPVALVVLDVDNFKRVNDAYGHAEGDRVLQLVAATLQGVVRIATDRVGRLGGEEFGLLLTGLSEEELPAVWGRLRAQLEGLAASLPLRVTVSAGIAAPFLEPPESPLRTGSLSVDDAAEALMKGADAALYEAKRTGRDRAVLSRGEAFEPLGSEVPAKQG